MAIFETITALIAKAVCCTSVQNWCHQDERVIVKTDSPNNSEDAKKTNEIAIFRIQNKEDSDTESKTPQSGAQELNDKSETSTHKESFKSTADVTASSSSEPKFSCNCRYQTANDKPTSLQEMSKKLEKIQNKEDFDTKSKTPQSGAQKLNDKSETSTHEESFRLAVDVTAPVAKSTASSSSEPKFSYNCSRERYQTANDESTSLQEMPKKLKKSYPLTSTKIKKSKCTTKNNCKLKQIFAKFCKKCK